MYSEDADMGVDTELVDNYVMYVNYVIIMILISVI